MPLREDLLTPISGANPSGINLRYDPVTDKVKEARREELEAPQGQWKTALKVADHIQAIKLASEAIAKRGKDLQLAVWLIDSHLRREGFGILPASFRFLRDLLDQFWDGLYPEIEDGDLEARASPLEWLGLRLEEPIRLAPLTSSGLSYAAFKQSRLVGFEAEATTDEKRKLRKQLVADGKLTPEEFDEAVAATAKSFYETTQQQLNESLETLQALNEFCDEKFGDVSPSFVKAKVALEEVGQVVRQVIAKKGGPTPPPSTAPAPAPAPAPMPPAATTADPVPAAPTPAPAPVATPVAVAPAPVAAAAPAAAPAAVSADPQSPEDVDARLAAICRYLRKKDSYDISPYLILRGYRFGQMRYNGAQIDAKMMEAPPPKFRADLKRFWADDDWDAVLQTTESAMELPCGRAWLDLQRYTVMALEKKGVWYLPMAAAVSNEVRGLVQELPGLLDLTLTDDSPIANAETRQWLQDYILSTGSQEMSAVREPVQQPVQQPVPQQAAEPVPPPPPAPAPQSERSAFVAPAIDLDRKPPLIEPEPVEEEVDGPDPFEDALQLAKSDKLGAAMSLLSKKLATERSGRGRFRRKVQQAHLLMAAGQDRIAYPILEDLASQIEERRLEDWERGEGLAYPLELLLRCLNAGKVESEVRKRLYARICRLDPVRALSCSD